MTTLTLYGPDFSYFLRCVRIMLQYKGLEYTLTKAPYGQALAYFGDEHAKLHPFRKLPVLIDGDRVIPETLAMAHYLDSKAGPTLFAEDALRHSHILGLANMISLYAHQALVKDIILEFAFPKGPDNAVRIDQVQASLPAGHKMLEWLSSTLANESFFTGGQFSVCDAYLIPMFDYLTQMPEPFNIISEYPSLLNYLAFHSDQSWSEGILGKANIPS